MNKRLTEAQIHFRMLVGATVALGIVDAILWGGTWLGYWK